MKTYELTYIISPEISSEEAEAHAKKIEALVQKKEGVILHQTNPSAKTLAYPIKKSASGFMGILEFEMEPEKVAGLQGDLSKNEKVIRKMLAVKSPIKAKKEKRIKITSDKLLKVEKQAKKPEIAKDSTKVELKDIEQKLDELLNE